VWSGRLCPFFGRLREPSPEGFREVRPCASDQRGRSHHQPVTHEDGLAIDPILAWRLAGLLRSTGSGRRISEKKVVAQWATTSLSVCVYNRLTISITVISITVISIMIEVSLLILVDIVFVNRDATVIGSANPGAHPARTIAEGRGCVCAGGARRTRLWCKAGA
jgi:hypothetical protein